MKIKIQFSTRVLNQIKDKLGQIFFCIFLVLNVNSKVFAQEDEFFIANVGPKDLGLANNYCLNINSIPNFELTAYFDKVVKNQAKKASSSDKTSGIYEVSLSELPKVIQGKYELITRDGVQKLVITKAVVWVKETWETTLLLVTNATAKDPLSIAIACKNRCPRTKLRSVLAGNISYTSLQELIVKKLTKSKMEELQFLTNISLQKNKIIINKGKFPYDAKYLAWYFAYDAPAGKENIADRAINFAGLYTDKLLLAASMTEFKVGDKGWWKPLYLTDLNSDNIDDIIGTSFNSENNSYDIWLSDKKEYLHYYLLK